MINGVWEESMKRIEDISGKEKEIRKLVLQKLVETGRAKHHIKWSILLVNKGIYCNDANYDVYNE